MLHDGLKISLGGVAEDNLKTARNYFSHQYPLKIGMGGAKDGLNPKSTNP